MEEGSTQEKQISGWVWMECVRFVAGEHFHNNRIGYLGFKTLDELVYCVPPGFFTCQVDKKP